MPTYRQEKYHRKDYVLLETVLREQYAHYGNLRVIYLVAKAIAEALHEQNPSFDVGRFLRIVEGTEPLPTNIRPENYRRV